MLLLVDRTQVLTLAAELARLEQDLVGDGWVVSRHDVARMTVAPAETDPGLWLARSNEVTQIKRLIQGEYRADPSKRPSCVSGRACAGAVFGHSSPGPAF